MLTETYSIIEKYHLNTFLKSNKAFDNSSITQCSAIIKMSGIKHSRQYKGFNQFF